MITPRTPAEMLDAQSEIDMHLGLQAAEGDVSGFESIYGQYFPRIQSMISHKFGDNPPAEDIAQEAFVKAYNAIGNKKYTYQGERSLFHWICRIAVNHAIDSNRSRSRLQVVSVDFNDDYLDYTSGNDFTEEIVATDSAEFMLRPLSPEFADAVRAVDIEGKQYHEYAEDNGIKMGTVRSRLHRARNEMRLNLEADQSTDF
jgi:RNA polymerase sigma factor (sigma-70 family)